MKLYKIKASGNGDALIKTQWVGSKDEGVAARKALYEAGYARKEVTELQVDIPTDKTGMLQWLNGNAV